MLNIKRTNMSDQKISKYLYFMVLLFLSSSIFAQKQEKMEQLSFLVGEWIGTTQVFENGVVVKEGAALRKNLL